jgi:hypothetical protein
MLSNFIANWETMELKPIQYESERPITNSPFVLFHGPRSALRTEDLF